MRSRSFDVRGDRKEKRAQSLTRQCDEFVKIQNGLEKETDYQVEKVRTLWRKMRTVKTCPVHFKMLEWL